MYKPATYPNTKNTQMLAAVGQAGTLNHRLLQFMGNFNLTDLHFHRLVCPAGSGLAPWAFFNAVLKLGWHEHVA